MRRFFTRIFYAADDGGAGGPDPSPAPEQDKQPETPDKTRQLEQQLAAERQAREAAEKKLADEAKARMTEDQRRQAELDEARDSLLAEHETLQLRNIGIDEEYLPLVEGTTADEVRRNGALLAKLLDDVRSRTEAKVKTELARTGAPGGRQDHDDEGGEMSSKDFFASILEGGTRK